MWGQTNSGTDVIQVVVVLFLKTLLVVREGTAAVGGVGGLVGIVQGGHQWTVPHWGAVAVGEGFLAEQVDSRWFAWLGVNSLGGLCSGYV